MWSAQDLFGGAMACEVPSSWRDVSNIRQVPDHQEVFQNIIVSSEMEGASLVIEILEHQQDIVDKNAASYFFHDLAESNGADPCHKFRTNDERTLPFVPHESLRPLSRGTNSGSRNDNTIVCTGTGVQRVAMGREHDMSGQSRRQTHEWIHVELCVVRLRKVSTDLLITLSCPTQVESDPRTTLSDVFVRILSTMEIKDWGLFG